MQRALAIGEGDPQRAAALPVCFRQPVHSAGARLLRRGGSRCERLARLAHIFRWSVSA
jgi:hypothetical protein